MLLGGFCPPDPNFYYYKICGGSKRYYIIREKDELVPKKYIPPEIIDSIRQFDPVNDYNIEKGILDNLNKKCEKYSKKLKGCTEMKEILKQNIEKLICDHGETLDIPWSSDNPLCYYRELPKKTVYAYREYRSIEDMNRRRTLILQNDKKILMPTRKIAKKLSFSPDLVKEFDEKWLIWSKEDQIEIINFEIAKTQSLLKRTQEQIYVQINGINLMLDKGVDTSQETFENNQKEKIQRRKEYKQRKKENFSSFFSREYSWYVPPKTGPKPGPPPKPGRPNEKHPNKLELACEILIKYNIHYKKEWKEWLRENHPDKGGNTEDCQKVISAGRELGY